ncbi:MAG: DNA polymerase III subunit alpha, partial [Clostridia bacterium]
MGKFAHLHVHSYFSFLDGVSSVETIVKWATEFGMEAIAITDHDNLCGAARLAQAARRHGIKPIHGVEITLEGGSHLVLLAEGPEGYSNICTILTEAYMSKDWERAIAGDGAGPSPEDPSDTAPSESAGVFPAWEGVAGACTGGVEIRPLLQNPDESAGFRFRPPRQALQAPGPGSAGDVAAKFAKRRLAPRVSLSSLEEHHKGIIALSGCIARGAVPALVRAGRYRQALEFAQRLAGIFGRKSFYIELQNLAIPGGNHLTSRLAELAEEIGVGAVATNDVHYCKKSDFALHDVLTCIRTLTRLDEVHPERRLNAENYLKPVEEMASVFRRHPEAVAAAGEITDRCSPGLPLDQKLFPTFVPPGRAGTSAEYLRRLVYEGASSRYGTITQAIKSRLDHELDVICTLGYEDYFLMVWDVADFARQKGIRFAGRGSAADSAVAYCLFITGVDPIARGLLFERFLSLERAQKPDIDIDFDARRRDEVRDYLQRKYGPERVATVCTFNTFRARSAVRDVGKAMGLPSEDIDRLAKRLPYMCADEIRAAFERYPELRGSGVPVEKYSRLFEVCEALAGVPRHIGTHLGGVVASRVPLVKVTPLQMAARGVVITQFDKDDVEEVGLIKLDMLSLRMLAAVEDSVGSSGVDYQRIPLDDEATYDMLNAGETVGTFQLESPAQRALQGQLGASTIEDIVASVALIRPGPVQGNMVEPFVARRRGLEDVTYVHPSLERILKKTYGVVLYQEQVIEIATAVAGFTPGESDRLRKVMTHYRARAEMDEIGKEFVRKAMEHGAPREVAETVLSYIVAYAGYGFCEAHAAAFADTAYKTAYLLRHFPAEFYTAILNNQPMGFYPPNTICVEARRRGVRILPVDINRSAERFTVEDGAIRVGLLRVRGMSEETATRIVASRGPWGYASIEDFFVRVPVDRDLLENLVLCGAFDSLCPNRRAALWEIARQLWTAERSGRRSREQASPNGSGSGDSHAVIPGLATPVRHGFNDSAGVASAVASAPAGAAGAGDSDGDGTRTGEDAGTRSGAGGRARNAQTGNGFLRSLRDIPDFSEIDKFKHEFYVLGLHPTKHPMEFYRSRLARVGVLTAAAAKEMESGTSVQVAGVVVRPHRPPTRSGRLVVFFSLEDETGLIDVTVFEDVYRRCRGVMFTSPVVVVEGRVERRGNTVSIASCQVRKDLP